MIRFLILFITVLTIQGCAVQTKVTAFYTDDADMRGTIGVVPINDNQKNSLEFSSMAKYLENKLTNVGYAKHVTSGKPDYVATVRYAIDGGRTIITDGATDVEFRRDIFLDIFKITDEKPKKVYEIKATSVGSCRAITAVLPAIFDSIFEKFPPQNGVTERRIVRWDGKC